MMNERDGEFVVHGQDSKGMMILAIRLIEGMIRQAPREVMKDNLRTYVDMVGDLKASVMMDAFGAIYNLGHEILREREESGEQTP